MRKFLAVVLAAVFTLGIASAVVAKPDLKFYGYQWLRYVHVVQGHELGASNEPPLNLGAGNQLDSKEESGFEIARTYIRMKLKDKPNKWEAALTLDIPNEPKGDYQAKAAYGIWVKYGYVDLKMIPVLEDIDAKIRVGLQKNYFGTVELWEYPTIEKDVIDKNKVLASADQGIALVGRIPGGWGAYELAMHNGTGYKAMEANIDKQYTGSLMLLPMPGVMVRGSYCTQNTAGHGVAATPIDKSAIVLSLASGPVSLLGEYVSQVNPSVGGAGTGMSGISILWMSVLQMQLMQGTELVLRWDNVNPDSIAKNDELNTYIAGVNYTITDGVLLQVNYQLDNQKQFSDGISKNINKIITQMKWAW